MPRLNDWLIQVFQVGTVLLFGPLATGVIARLEAIVQQRHGPRLLQPYYDVAKLFRKETVLPDAAGPVFRIAPYVSFAAYLTVPLLIPVLTIFPLQLGYMGDILGGGFLLGMASFAVSLAAIDSGSPYAQLGSSRLRSFGALGEPTVIFVVFTVALITQTDLPYALVATLKSSAVEVLRPAHLLAATAFFMVVAPSRSRSRSRTPTEPSSPSAASATAPSKRGQQPAPTRPSNRCQRRMLTVSYCTTHKHAFDLLVIGRVHQDEPLPRRVIGWASLPVLVIAEEPQT